MQWNLKDPVRQQSLARILQFTDDFVLRARSKEKRKGVRAQFLASLQRAGLTLADCSAQDVLLFVADEFLCLYHARRTVLAPSTVAGAVSAMKTLFDEFGRGGMCNPAASLLVKRWLTPYCSYAPTVGVLERSVPVGVLSQAKFDALVVHLDCQLAAVLHACDFVEAFLALRDGTALTFFWESLHRPADSQHILVHNIYVAGASAPAFPAALSLVPLPSTFWVLPLADKTHYQLRPPTQVYRLPAGEARSFFVRWLLLFMGFRAAVGVPASGPLLLM